jgi:hypothetical protein
MGRPSSYTDEIADEICERIENGESLIKICEDDHMPNRRTVLRWIDAIPDFASKHARAREAQGDHAADRMSLIENDVLAGVIDPTAARVVLGSMQWRAAKLAPKKYSEKLLNEHSGPDGAPIQTQSTVLDAKLLTFEERQKMRELLETAAARKGKE